MAGGREGLGNLRSDGVPVARFTERDDAPTEASARHPGTEGARRPSGLDRQVDGRARDLEVVTHRCVGGVEQGGEGTEVAGVRDVSGLEDACVLGDHVPDATPHDRGRSGGGARRQGR